MENKLLTKKDALEYLEHKISLYQLNAEIKAGHLAILTVGKRIYLTPEAIEQWRSNTTNLTAYTNAAKSTTRIYHTSELKAQEYNLGALVKQRNEQRLKDSLLRKLQKCKRNIQFQPAEA